MNIDSRDSFLSTANEAINADSFLLNFSVSSNAKLDVEQLLLQQLRTGCFHFDLVVQDIERGYNNYSHTAYNFHITPLQFVFLPRPGNVWNGKEKINYQPITIDEAEDLLVDLLAGGKEHFTVSTLGKPLEFPEARKSVQEFLKEIGTKLTPVEVYNIKPDFLRTVDEYYNSNHTLPGYFEEHGRDLALAFKTEEDLYILLTNGYG